MDPRVPRLVEALGGRDDARLVRAPGRVNLIGDHTDYNEGYVLPMAIGLDCLLAYGGSRVGRVRASSLELDGVVDVAAAGTDLPADVEPSWGRFVAGAVAALAARGAHIGGAEIALSSSVPAGSGLSSSSALSVALTLSLADVGGVGLSREELALAALDAEVRATGVPGGLMDQLTSLYGVDGHALLIDCRSLAVEPIPLPEAFAVVVVHSGLARTLVGSAYAERRAACEAVARRLGVTALRDASPHQVHDDPIARHVVSETRRVLDFAGALRAGDTVVLGPLLTASHASLRDDFQVSTPELDALVELLVDAGALGARLTGAGFGGCVVALSPRDRADRVLEWALPRYRAATGLEPSGFVARAVDGAGPLPLTR